MEGRDRALAEGSAWDIHKCSGRPTAKHCNITYFQDKEEFLSIESITESLSMNAHVFIRVHFINYREKDIQKDNTFHWAETWTMLSLLSPWKWNSPIAHLWDESKASGQDSFSLVRGKRIAPQEFPPAMRHISHCSGLSCCAAGAWYPGTECCFPPCRNPYSQQVWGVLICHTTSSSDGAEHAC